MSSRTTAIGAALAYFDDGRFEADLARRVACRTESQDAMRAGEMERYLDVEMRQALEALGFECRILRHDAARAPFLFASRIEDPALPTVLGYGHGDVVLGDEGAWPAELAPFALACTADRFYGRGTADNKAQHTINIAALGAVLAARGRLGFNAKYLIEMGEETGSPGLAELCAEHRDLFAADVLIASDGPRVDAARPTLFLGSRGGLNFDLAIRSRDGAHHSGNWGGLISNPGIQLAHAIASITGPTGQIRIHEWLPPDGIPAAVRAALLDCAPEPGADGPAIESGWGEPGLTPAEQVYGWCNFEVLSFRTGSADRPVNAIPSEAWARCQLRFVTGVDKNDIVPALRRHLVRNGFPMVEVSEVPGDGFDASRTDPGDPWVAFALESLRRTSNAPVAVLPNLGGSLPNAIFTGTLGLPTVWIPHSYPACRQHAPGEHVLASLVREGLGLMAGIYWDIGAGEAPRRTARA